jgi:pimeloyl-ACP methyl ester carboxylesterase
MRQAQLAAATLALLTTLSLGARADGLPLRMEVQGSGERTVIFEAGLGNTHDVWRQVQSKIAFRCARTVAYTRAGYPGSPRSSGVRDAITVVGELRAALHNRGISPPYVLVGHSLGGLYMQYFARNFAQEVSGLLLVDSTHWQHIHRLQTEAPASYRMVRMASMLMLPIMKRELRDLVIAGEQVHESPSPADGIPVTVLSSTKPSPGDLPSFRELAERMQDEIAADYPGSRHIRVEGSAHYIQRDRPDVVIAAARELAGCNYS